MKNICVAISIGCFIRILLLLNNVASWVSNRPELLTTYDSFKNLKEGSFLQNRGISPYAGDSFHQPPLVLLLFNWMIEGPYSIKKQNIDAVLAIIFMFVDICIAFLLRAITQHLLKEHIDCGKNEETGSLTSNRIEEKMSEKIKPSIELPELFSKENLVDTVPSVYFLNPATLLISVAPSIHPLTTLATLAAIYFAQKKAVLSSACFVSLATYLSIYPACLLIPVTLMLSKEFSPEPLAHLQPVRFPVLFFLWMLIIWGSILALLLFGSFMYMGSWHFLNEAYGWVLVCGDLTPNIGLYWYFFAEAFLRFKGYFLLVFFAHPFLYVVPLTLRLGMYPLKLASIFVAIYSIFKVYPCLGDTAFVMCLFLMSPETIRRMRHTTFFAVALTFPLLLMPVMLYLWLVTGSGNVNFFYFQSLVYNFCASIFVLQFTSGCMRHRKALVETRKELESNKDKS